MIREWLLFGLTFAIALVGATRIVVMVFRSLEKRTDQLNQTINGNGGRGLVRRVEALEDPDLDRRLASAEKKIEELRDRIHGKPGNLVDRLTVMTHQVETLWDERKERKER